MSFPGPSPRRGRTPLGLGLIAAACLTVPLTSPAAGAPAPDAVSAAVSADDPDPQLVQAAEVNDLTTAELTELLAEDPAVEIGVGGRLLYRDPVHAAPSSAAVPAVPPAPFPYDETFALHSRPGAQRTVYLDFDGHTVSGTAWNDGLDGIPAASYPGLQVDGNPGFSAAERDIVQDVWLRVAEDYAPFDVDVTTEDPGPAALTRSGSGDQVFGMRALVTDDSWCGRGCAGVAYVDVFDAPGSAYYQPAWAFSAAVRNDPIQIAETISHEVGHTLGLHHDGEVGGSDYYDGPGMWSPVMGAGIGALTQFSQGGYPFATETQDDLAVMSTSGTPYRGDDHGGPASPTTLVPAGAPVRTGTASGVIGRRGDTDWFSLVQPCAGPLAVTADPAPRGPNLDVELRLRPLAGGADVVADPASREGADEFTPLGLDASLAVDVPAGGYLVGIDGVGRGSFAGGGYDDYGSLGAYAVSATVADCVEPTPPGAPSGLAATSTARSVSLSWQPPLADGDSPVTGFAVSLAGETLSLGPEARTATFIDLDPGTAYAVSVRAVNGVGVGPATTLTVRTFAVRPSAARIRDARPGEPGGLVTALARWRSPVSAGGAPVTAYRVRALRLDADGDVVARRTVTAAADLRRLRMVLQRGRYRFVVRAVNAVGAGPWSARSNRVAAR